MVAIEAKLCRWRDALRQAETYTQFADRVVVAMDLHGVPRASSAASLFRKRGIGLCGLSPHATEWLVRPESNPDCRGPEWEYLVATAPAPSAQTLWSLR